MLIAANIINAVRALDSHVVLKVGLLSGSIMEKVSTSSSVRPVCSTRGLSEIESIWIDSGMMVVTLLSADKTTGRQKYREFV